MVEKKKLMAKDLRAALKCWGDAPVLGVHEISTWKIASESRLAAGYDDTAAGRGLAVRDVLQRVIQDLRPESDEPRQDDPRWRAYFILKERYIDGRSPAYLAEKLSIARSTYNHAQLKAENLLLARLQEWEEGSTALEGTGHTTSIPLAVAKPFMAPPRRPKGLIGRDELTSQLRQKLVERVGGRLALWGLPGVGKTAMAVELAHDSAVREKYPDGVLWTGFGANPDLSVLLHLFASALGLPHELMAALDRFEDRARVIQNAIAGRRMLIVIDDVWHTQHALAFQFGGAECALLVTTRSPGLIQSLTDFDPVEVPELTLEASLGLLEQYAPQAVRVRRVMLSEAIEHIGGLPLTMVLVGGFLRKAAYAAQPRRLAEALGRLREIETWGRVAAPVSPFEGRPGLDAGAELSLFGVIGMSEDELDDEARSALSSLARFPPTPATFSEELAIAATGGRGEQLDALVDAGLLESAGDDRYRLHSAILHYVSSRGIDPGLSTHFVRVILSWMEAHRDDPLEYEPEAASIRRALVSAEQIDLIVERCELAHLYFQYLKRTGLHRQAIDMLTPVLEAARGEALKNQRITLNLDCGQALQQTGAYEAARAHYMEAKDQTQEMGEQDSVLAALQGLGSIAYSQGDLETASNYFREGLAAAEAGRLIGRQAAFLSNLGTMAVSQGDLETAKEHFESGLALAHKAADPDMATALLSNLGTVYAGSGDREGAASAFQRALAMAKENGDRVAMVALLTNLGALAHDQQKNTQAREAFEQALDLAREVEDRARVSQLLANLGALMTVDGEFDKAEEYLKKGQAIAEGIGHREHSILLQINLAELQRARGEAGASLITLESAAQLAEDIQHARYIAIIGEMLSKLSGATTGVTEAN